MKRYLALFVTLTLVLTAVWTVGGQAACNHQYGNPEKVDDTYHRLTCTICGKTIKQKHGTTCTGTDGDCDICGATGVKTELQHVHLYYKTDTIYHTQICEDCGTVLAGPEFHTVDYYGRCVVCGETGLSQKVTKLSLRDDDKDVLLEIGAYGLPTHILLPEIEPDNAADKTLIYVSSNTKVAKVENGVITGIDEGTCTVTISTADGSNHSVTVNVTVVEKLVEEIKVTPKKKTVQVGDILQLTAAVEPYDALDPSYVWESSDDEVAIVDEYGMVEAMGPGTCVITATALDPGGVVGQCKLTVRSGEVTKITLNSYKQTLKLKEKVPATFQIVATVYPADATDQSLIYTSSDPSVATVTDTGLVTGVSPGTCTIRVTAGDGYGAMAELTVKVKNVIASRIDLSETDLKMIVAGGVMPTAQLYATVYPTSATNVEVIWSSDNEAVATVNEYGYVEAVDYGTCNIICKTKDGGATAKCKVTVVNKPITQLILNMSSVTLRIEEGRAVTAQLYVTIVPADAQIQDLTYSTSDKNVATVNDYGMITAISPGKCKITVRATDGSGAKAVCKVTVISGAVDSLKLNVKKKTLEMSLQNPTPTYQLKVKVEPAEAAGTPLEWESSDESIATVSSTGLVTAVGPGVCTITVSSDDGAVSDSMTLTVRKPSTAQVKLNYTSKTIIWDPTKIQTLQLKAKVTPTDAYNRRIIWESDTPAVATVSANGLVTVHGVGVAIITASTVDGSALSASCKISVIYKPIKSIRVTPAKKELTLKYGQTVTVQLKTTIRPTDAGEQSITWSSSNPDVATVDDYGLVTAVAPGTCTITAHSEDGSGKKGTCAITVKAILVKTLTVKKTSIVLEVGEPSETYQLKPVISPKNASNPELVYSSSNEAVAKVTDDGLIQAISYGTCTITISTTDGSKKSVKVTVTVK